MKNKKCISILLIILTIITLQGCKNEEKSSEVRDPLQASKVIDYVNKYGLVEDKKAWNKVLKDTDNGKDITSYEELNRAVRVANHHASIDKTGLKTWENMPTMFTDKKHNLKIINLPSTYPSSNPKSKRYKTSSTNYMTKAKSLIKQVPANQPLILNLANNVGGDPYEMIGAVADYIPNGLLWSEIPKRGSTTTVSLTSKSIAIKTSKKVKKVPILRHSFKQRKIYVIINE